MVLTIMADGLHRVVPFDRELVIGRSRTADIYVNNASLSRHHARLRPAATAAGPATIADLSSANGTRVGGQRLAPHTEAPLWGNELVELGRVVVTVRASNQTRHPRQIWVHDYFESLLDAECARAAASASPLAVLRISFEDAPSPRAVQEALFAIFGQHHVVGYYAPDEYEVLLAGMDATEAEALAAAAVDHLAMRGLAARVGVACYRRDGIDAAELLRRAGHAARPSAAALGPVPILAEVPVAALEDIVERVAAGDISVLIEGETGVGKEVLAERIHRSSPRAGKPLVKINCAALSAGLMESALFGHVRGAFTGAIERSVGLIASAEGGTLFLDEVGEIPLEVQVKLLRVLEDRVVTPVGATQGRRIDVRFIAATNRDLDLEVARGHFRSDFYFRIAGVNLRIPPLRERTAEVPGLVEHFLHLAAETGAAAAPPDVSDAALEELLAYAWPGNIRELRNMIERAILLSGGATILPEHLPLQRMRALRLASEPGDDADAPAPLPSGDAIARAAVPSADELAEHMRRELDAVERRYLEDALRRVGGLQAEAAQLLGVSRRTLINKMERLGISRPLKDRRGS